MKKSIMAIMIISMLTVSFGLVNAVEVGDNISGLFPFLNKPVFPVTYEQRRAEIDIAQLGGLLGSNASTRIDNIWLVDNTYTVIVTYTDDDQYGYVDEGEVLNYIIVNINVSKAYVANGSEAMNNTRVYLLFMPTGEDPIVTGYMTAVGAGIYDTCYKVMFQAYVPYTFEAGTYIVYTEYDVRY